MRELKDYNTKDNLKYIRQEYGDLYSCLKEMVKNYTSKIIEIDSQLEDPDDFNSVLEKIKARFPITLTANRGPADLEHDLGINSKALNLIEDPEEKRIVKGQLIARFHNNLVCVYDVFENMFLDSLDRYDFQALDPEIQKLYLKAQKAIDKENKK